MLGVRLSSERFGIKLGESKQLAQELMMSDKLDFLDMSLWDCFKEPQEEEYKGKTLLQHFAELDKGNTRLGVAGNIRTPQDATRAMEADIDWIIVLLVNLLLFVSKKKIHKNLWPRNNQDQ